MRIRLLVIGRPRHSGLADAIQDYEKRAANYWPLDILEIKEEVGRYSPEEVRQKEGMRLQARLGDGEAVVLCDPGGKSMDSDEFAKWLQQFRVDARDVTFVIGGAYGVGDSLRSRARQRLSLAPFTLPHELARLVLVEQLYRAGTIVRGEPYHK